MPPAVRSRQAFDLKASRIKRKQAGLVVVDVQERLVTALFERQRVIENVVRLVRGAAILQVRTVLTEQYPQGLGRTIPEVARAISGLAPLEKTAFSACGASGFIDALGSRGIRRRAGGKSSKAVISDVILCGIETHVCVSQTCLDLLQQGFRVFVVADAVTSRTLENHCLGLERMRDAGAAIVSTEMVLFELLERAGTDEFKQILPLVK